MILIFILLLMLFVFAPLYIIFLSMRWWFRRRFRVSLGSAIIVFLMTSMLLGLNIVHREKHHIIRLGWPIPVPVWDERVDPDNEWDTEMDDGDLPLEYTYILAIPIDLMVTIVLPTIAVYISEKLLDRKLKISQPVVE